MTLQKSAVRSYQHLLNLLNLAFFINLHVSVWVFVNTFFYAVPPNVFCIGFNISPGRADNLGQRPHCTSGSTEDRRAYSDFQEQSGSHYKLK